MLSSVLATMNLTSLSHSHFKNDYVKYAREDADFETLEMFLGLLAVWYYSLLWLVLGPAGCAGSSCYLGCDSWYLIHWGAPSTLPRQSFPGMENSVQPGNSYMPQSVEPRKGLFL